MIRGLFPEVTSLPRPSFAAAAFVVALFAVPARAEVPERLSPPPPGSFVVDTTGQLRPGTVFELNKLAAEVKASGKGQLAVLVVNSTESRNPRQFATVVFNRWGIGNAGRDDGVLLFAALGDRKAEIILGDGLDDDDGVERSERVMERVVVPAFKRGNPNAAMLEGAGALVELIHASAINGGAAAEARPAMAVNAPPEAERFQISLPRAVWVADVDSQVGRELQQRLNELSWSEQAEGRPPFVFVFYDPEQHGGAQLHQVAAWAGDDLRLTGNEWLITLAPRHGEALISADGSISADDHRAELFAAQEELGMLGHGLFVAINDREAQARFNEAAQKLSEFRRTGKYPRSINEQVSRAVSEHSTTLFGSFAAAFGLGTFGLMRWARRRPRTCQDCQTPRQLLDEAYDDVHLTVGQKKEEQVKSVDYDVWWCGRCRDALVLRYGTFFSSYHRCGSCNHVTQKHSTRTLVAANYDHGGTIQVDEHCEHCGYHRTYQRHTARLTRSSSSSSSRSSFGSSSSRSSFGGGSSSGRGSSGSW